MTLLGVFNENQFEFPLTQIQVQVSTVDDTAVASIDQTYSNCYDKPIEPSYRLPIYRDAVIHDLSFKFANRNVTCKVQELTETTGYSQTCETKNATLMQERHGDDYSLKLSKINPDETVVVSIKYIVNLPRDIDSRRRRFTFPTTTICPKYDNRPLEQLNYPKSQVKNPPSLYDRITDGNFLGPAFSNHQKQFYSCIESQLTKDKEKDTINYSTPVIDKTYVNFKMQVLETQGFSNVILPNFNGYTVSKKRIDEYKFYCEIENIDLKTDYVVTILTENAGKPVDQCSIWGEKYKDDTTTYKISFNESLLFKTDNEQKYEFLFVLDRSNSMNGDKFENAKRALAVALNVLPIDSYFNIYSFGTNWSHFYPRSTKYSQETFEGSKQILNELEADMGGTELNDMLNYIYRVPEIDGYKRRIILITDGELSDLQSILDIVHRHSTIPIFTVGVGNSVSHELVNGLSEYSNGCCEIILDSNLLEIKILQQLRRAMYSPTTVNVVGQTHDLRPGQTTLFVVPASNETVKEEFIELGINHWDVSYIQPVNWSNMNTTADEGDAENKDVDIDKESETEASFYPTYPLRLQWARNRIRELTRQIRSPYADVADLRKTIVALSMEYGILSPYTAFIGTLENSTESVQGEIPSSNHSVVFSLPHEIYQIHNKTAEFYQTAMKWCTSDEPTQTPSKPPKQSTTIETFKRCLTYEGSISHEKLSRQGIYIPDKPENCSNEDMWSTVLFLAYLNVSNLDDDDKWVDIVNKMMNFVLSNGNQKFEESYPCALRYACSIYPSQGNAA
jgi:hypothetical protein